MGGPRVPRTLEEVDAAGARLPQEIGRLHLAGARPARARGPSRRRRGRRSGQPVRMKNRSWGVTRPPARAWPGRARVAGRGPPPRSPPEGRRPRRRRARFPAPARPRRAAPGRLRCEEAEPALATAVAAEAWRKRRRVGRSPIYAAVGESSPRTSRMLASPPVPALALVALLALTPLPFPTSGSPAAQPSFLRGVTALHNFHYEDAVQFREAQSIDPGFAMAYWGEAMACNQTLWLNQDARWRARACSRLGPTAEARAAKARRTARRATCGRSRSCTGAGDRAARDRAYAEAMGRLASAYPDDPEVQTFYALALMGTTARSPALFREGDDDSTSTRWSEARRRGRWRPSCERVLRPIPAHPGALHYMIHDYDDPDHARLALPAARAYAKVAPESSHALHMPAHIFLQLGMWDDAAASDDASFARPMPGSSARASRHRHARLSQPLLAALRVAPAGPLPEGPGDARPDPARGGGDRGARASRRSSRTCAPGTWSRPAPARSSRPQETSTPSASSSRSA